MINKKENINLQITLNKADYKHLIELQAQLKGLLNIDLNKSQIITFLIRNYGKGTLKSVDTTKEPSDKKAFDYQTAIRNLKEIMDLTFPNLAIYIGIPESTLKKYSRGIQNPTGENKRLLDEALIKNGLK